MAMTEGDPRVEHEPTMRLVPRREPGFPTDALDLFAQDVEPTPPGAETPAIKPPARKMTIDELFVQFRSDHPEVLDEFVALARRAKSEGRKRIGAKALIETIRWTRGITINNVLTSRVTRWAQETHPDIAEMFTLRELKAR
jgi:hypothetical protein